MGTKKLTDFPVQSVLDYSSQLYVVPFSGVNAFTDMRVPITVMFNAPTFTGLTSVSGLNIAGGVLQQIDSGLYQWRATNPANLNSWRLISGISGVSDGTFALQHSTDNFSSNTTNAFISQPSGATNFPTALTVNGDTVATLTASQTFTNKTLTAPIISSITNGAATLTLPTTTDTIVGRATTDTLTSKTLTTPTINGASLSGTFSGTPTFSGNVTYSSTLTPSQTAGIVGTTTNNNANAGSVGEFISANASGISLSNGVTANITSISLTAGDWDVSGVINFGPAGSTIMQGYSSAINTVSATLGAVGTVSTVASVVPAGAGVPRLPAPIVRFSLPSTTTVFLIASAQFTTSTCVADGFISARRVR